MTAYLSQLQISTPSPNLRGSASNSGIEPFPNSSSNTSSCTSSTPSSPAVMITSQPTTVSSVPHSDVSGTRKPDPRLIDQPELDPNLNNFSKPDLNPKKSSKPENHTGFICLK